MKTLYLIESQSAWGQVFVDEFGELIGYVHENDGTYIPENHYFIVEFFGGKVIELNSNKIDVEEEYFDDPIEYVESHKKRILKQINKSRLKESKK